MNLVIIKMEKQLNNLHYKTRTATINLLVGVLLVVFFMSFASAEFLSTITTKDSPAYVTDLGAKEYPQIVVKDLMGLGKDLATITLTKHDTTCGASCLSEFTIVTGEESALIDDIKFYTLSNDGEVYSSPVEQSIRSYQINYWGNIIDYETQCVYSKAIIDEKNGTEYTPQTCSQVEIGSHNGWVSYNIGEKLPTGTYQIQLLGEKRPSRSVDWIIETQGKTIYSLATWGNISLGDEAEVILNNPTDNSNTTSLVTFNVSANVTTATLVNFTLYDNSTGTWGARNTTNADSSIAINYEPTVDNTYTSSSTTEARGQTFTTISQIYLDKIGLKMLLESGTPSGNVNFYIYSTSLGLPTGSPISSGTKLANTFAGSLTEYNITMSAITLNASTQYAIVFVNSGSYNIGMGVYNGGGYSGGQSISTSSYPTDWSGSTKDAWFKIYPSSNITKTTIFYNTYPVGSTYKWNVQACDSDGDCGFATANRTFSTSLSITGESYSSSILTGSITPIIINITTGGTNINYAYLNYNGTQILGSLSNVGNDYTITVNKVIPSISSTTNITFNWSIIQGSITTITTSHNQTIQSIGVDDCSVNTVKLFDLYLRDEESYINITNSSIDTYTNINSTIEIDLNVYSKVELLNILNFSKLYYNKNPASVCLSVNLSNSSYYMDATFKYFAEPYAQENYNIQRYNLNATTLYQNITLYDLLLTKSTEFQISLLSKGYSPIANALIVIDKRYVSEGIFKTVEIAKTDSNGKTVVHLDEKDATYNIYAYKNGVLITSYTNVVAVCQDILTGTCTITLREASDTSTLFNTTSDKKINYDLTYNSGTKILTLTFSSINTTLYNVSIESYMQTEIGSSLLCTNSLYVGSGTLTCNVTGATGKSSIVTFIYVDGDLIDVEVINIASTGVFSTAGYLIFFLLIVTVIFMFYGSKTGMVIGAILGLIASGYMGLVEGSKFGLGSAIIWFIVAGVILLYKLNSNGGSQ